MADGLAPSPGAASPLAPPLFVGGTPLYLSGEDGLTVSILNSAPGVTVRVAGRFLELASRYVSPFSFDVTPATDRTVSARTQPLPAGWLLDACAIVTGGGPSYGQTWVRLSLTRGGPLAGLEVSTLAYGYVTPQHRVSWPAGTQVGTLDGPGALRSITGTVPAAGGEILETVPTNARWDLIALYFQFVTSAVVGNRYVQLTLDDGINRFHRLGNAGVQAGGGTRRYNYFPGSTYTAIDNNSQSTQQYPQPLPLAAGWRFGTNTSVIDVGDQFSAVQYVVREWIEGTS